MRGQCLLNFCEEQYKRPEIRKNDFCCPKLTANWRNGQLCTKNASKNMRVSDGILKEVLLVSGEENKRQQGRPVLREWKLN